jgi:adenine-specific DNA-methyltransferase
MARRPTRDTEINDYRHDETRLNNPEVGLAALGEDHSPPTARGQARYFYNPHLDPVLRFDADGRADRAAELAALAQQRALTASEGRELAALLAVHEPWLEWTGKREYRTTVIIAHRSGPAGGGRRRW